MMFPFDSVKMAQKTKIKSLFVTKKKNKPNSLSSEKEKE